VTEGIVLAGGYASRMSQNKMMLPFAGKPLIAATIMRMRSSVNRIIIVTGHYHVPIASYFSEMSDITIVFNPDYERGMFTSVQRGVQETKSDFFVTPGDYPLISENTYQSLILATGKIRVPVYRGQRGHPIFFDHTMKGWLLACDPSDNLKAFRDRYEVNYVDVDDPGVIQDIDTPSDYQHLNRGGKPE